MVPDQSKACVGLEYFCFQGDELWEMAATTTLVELAKRELDQLGLVAPEKVERGFVTRVPLAYPMYDADYSERVDVIRGWLEGISNLQQVGRNGLHRYNNSDHSMLTAMRAVENIVTGAGHDLWAVNAESVYHEEDVKEEQPVQARARDARDARAARLRGSAGTLVWTDVRCPGCRALASRHVWRAMDSLSKAREGFAERRRLLQGRRFSLRGRGYVSPACPSRSRRTPQTPTTRRRRLRQSPRARKKKRSRRPRSRCPSSRRATRRRTSRTGPAARPST